VLLELCRLSTDWSGSRHCGLAIDWDCEQRTVDISMPGCVERALQRFQHPAPAQGQHSPHKCQDIKHGAKTQCATPSDDAPVLDATDVKRVQEVTGAFLHCARAVDSTMLKALNAIASQQAKGAEATMKAVTHLLNCAAAHPNAVVRFHASDMVLWVDSDASYLSEPEARSCCAGHHCLSSRPADPAKAPPAGEPPPPFNGAIHVPVMILKEVASAASEAELAGLFHNGKDAVSERITLEELGHPQPPTPMQTDNSAASGIANDTVKQKRSKAIDMRCCWVRDRVRQGHFHVCWRKGVSSKSDCFTKHHPARHHQAIRSAHLHDPAATTARNHFDILQEEDEANDSNPSQEFSLFILITVRISFCLTLHSCCSDCCEGVLKSHLGLMLVLPAVTHPVPKRALVV